MKRCELILALDLKTVDCARAMLDKLSGSVRYIKIGPRLFTLGGKGFAEELINRGYKLFLDLKLHDIPNTVASAVEPLAELGLWALTVHTSGGYEMMARSVAARDNAGSGMKLLGITVLTSLGGGLWDEVHPNLSVEDALLARTNAAERAGLDGIVCSPLDLGLLRGKSEKLIRVVPGIRSSAVSTEDQTRTATVEEAAKNGADYIVVGRPILEARDPVSAARDIMERLAGVTM